MVSEAWFLGQPWSWMFPLPCNVLFLSPIRLLMLLRILALPKLLTCAPHHIIILTPVSTSLLLELWTRCNFVYQSILSDKLMITISMNYKDNHLCIHQPSTFFKSFVNPHYLYTSERIMTNSNLVGYRLQSTEKEWDAVVMVSTDRRYH